jgi:hypothetical protein
MPDQPTDKLTDKPADKLAAPDKSIAATPTAPAPATTTGQPDRPQFTPSPYQTHLATAAKDAGLEGPDAHRAIVEAEKVNALRLAESHVAQARQAIVNGDPENAAGVLGALEERIAEARAAGSDLAAAAIVGMAKEAFEGLGLEAPGWVGGAGAKPVNVQAAREARSAEPIPQGQRRG